MGVGEVPKSSASRRSVVNKLNKPGSYIVRNARQSSIILEKGVTILHRERIPTTNLLLQFGLMEFGPILGLDHKAINLSS